MKASKWVVLLALAGALPATLLIAAEKAAREAAAPGGGRAAPRPRREPARLAREDEKLGRGPHTPGDPGDDP